MQAIVKNIVKVECRSNLVIFKSVPSSLSNINHKKGGGYLENLHKLKKEWSNENKKHQSSNELVYHVRKLPPAQQQSDQPYLPLPPQFLSAMRIVVEQINAHSIKRNLPRVVV